MNKKSKGIIIDFVILGLYCFLVYFGVYVLYDNYPTFSRTVAMLIIFINIPLVWGACNLSLLGKKTIGHRLAEKDNINVIIYFILAVIFISIIFLYIWYMFLYTYRELPLIDCDYYAKAEQYSEITNYYGIRNIEKGKILTEEKIVDTSKLGRKKIILTIENNYGKKRQFQYFINIVEKLEKCEISLRDSRDNLIFGKELLKDKSASLVSDKFGIKSIHIEIKDKDKVLEKTDEISKKKNNMIIIWKNFDESTDCYENEKNNCGTQDSKCLSVAVVSHGFNDYISITGNVNQDLVNCINNSWN